MAIFSPCFSYGLTSVCLYVSVQIPSYKDTIILDYSQYDDLMI